MKISIVGTGWVGSTAAYTIATQGLAEEVVLIDVASNIAAAHSIDIAEAAAVCRRDIVIRAGIYEDMAGSDIVIVTASAPVQRPASPTSAPAQPSRRLGLGRNIVLISKIGRAVDELCPRSIVITTSNPVEALSYTSYLVSRDRDRKRFIGYTINDTTRFRVWISQMLGTAPSQVDIFALGEHGDSQVPIFSKLLVQGKPAKLTEAMIQELRKKPLEYLKNWSSLKSGRSSGWLSGAGLATLVKAIRDDARETFPCSAILDGQYGYSGFSIGVPAAIGRDGIYRIFEWKIDADERKRLAESAAVLKEAAQAVDAAYAEGFKEAEPGITPAS